MQCPSCRSTRVYPSRRRNLIERARQSLTGKQPVRCHACGWRSWRQMIVHEEHAPVHPDDLRTGRSGTPVSAVDLERLDPAARS